MKRITWSVIAVSIFLLSFALPACGIAPMDQRAEKISPPEQKTLSKASFTVTKIEFSPSPATEGRSAWVQVSISNTGQSDGVYQSVLVVDGATTATRDVRILAGSNKVESFEIKNIKAGSHQVSMGDYKATLLVNKPCKITYCLFRSDTSGTWQGTTYVTPNIYIAEEDGRAGINVTNIRQQHSFPDFSPDGSKIVFQANREWHGQPRIYTMNADGSEVALLTRENFICEFPSWSPDSNWIAYSRWDAGIQAFTTTIPRNIWITSPQGENSKMISTTGPGLNACDQFSSWFPDSKAIAFESNREGFWQIYTMPLDGSPVRCTELGSHCYAPAVSPDGKKIAYSSGGSIYIHDIATKKSTRITSPELSASFPSWHPDGSKIIFTSGIQYNLHGWKLISNLAVCTVHSDGSNFRMLIPLGFFGKYQK